ncbi:MAG: DMT family transporter [Phycisphaerae bacterium]|nr:DMT family transporter [Phycisphaerae bacterium]
MSATIQNPERPRWLTPLRADGLLLACAVIWGISFIWQKWANEHVGPLTFVGVRSLLGAIVVAPLLCKGSVRAALKDPTRRRSLIMGGLAAGACLAAASAFQQTGLKTTTITNAGFITGLYVVFVPFIGWFLGQRIGWTAWVAVMLSLGGLTLLSFSHVMSVDDLAGFIEGLNRGDLWVLACAAAWAVHVHVVGWAAPRSDAIALSVLQFVVSGVLATAFAFAFESPSMDSIGAAAAPIVLSAILAVGVAFTLQAVAQDVAPPTHTAILLSLEGVFCAIAGAVWLGEELGVRHVVGAALLLAAALLAQVPPRSTRGRNDEQQRP